MKLSAFLTRAAALCTLLLVVQTGYSQLYKATTQTFQTAKPDYDGVMATYEVTTGFETGTRHLPNVNNMQLSGFEIFTSYCFLSLNHNEPHF